MQNKTGFGDNAVHAFFLHTGQPAQSLVGHVLAKARQADFIAAQVHHVAHAAAHVLDHKNRSFCGKNFVARVIFAFDGDDFTSGRHHAPPQQIVQRGAVFKGHWAAGIF